MKHPTFSKIRSTPWAKLGRVFEGFGWELEVNSPRLKRFSRGSEKVSAVRLPGEKWKVLYLEKGKTVDFAGVMEEEFAKMMAGELLLLKSMSTRWSSS